MAQDDDIADNVISGSLKRSASYHQEYGGKTYQEIKELAGSEAAGSKGPANEETD